MVAQTISYCTGCGRGVNDGTPDYRCRQCREKAIRRQEAVCLEAELRVREQIIGSDRKLSDKDNPVAGDLGIVRSLLFLPFTRS